jgi:para-nitrobenzyl esterase
MINNKQAVVETNAGKIEGDYRDGLYVFKGVPYAAPPVKELRWLPTQPVKPWEGVRRAKAFGAIAPQNQLPGGDVIEALLIDEVQDEDCLFLNIWSPGLDNARRPVMVWIHGGAFIIGSGSQPIHTGGLLAARGDIVFVSINYRLGALGFMNLREVTGGKIPAMGNEGLLDQVAALEWVRDNIAAFGGDPDNVTVFGESAGAMSIGCLMAMPIAQGKFHKAILESGAANTVGALDDSVKITEQYLKILDVHAGDVEAMRSLTVKQLLSAQQELEDKMREAEHRITPFQPVVDGITIPEMPIKAINNGSANNIAVLAGTNLEEWKLMSMMEPDLRNLDEAGMVDRLESIIPAEHVPALIDSYRNARKRRGDATSPIEILTAIQTDLMFRMPVVRLIEAQCNNDQPAYNYLFTWKSPVMGGILGACHALEIGFLFGNYDDSFCGSGPEADVLSRNIQDAWLAFARTGDPSCESIGSWIPYGERRVTMILDKECHIEEAPYEDERSAWDMVSMEFTKPI